MATETTKVTANYKGGPKFVTETKGIWKLVETALQHLRVVMVCGLPGVGKTFTAQEADANCITVNMSEDTMVQELFCTWKVTKDGMELHDGPVMIAFREGRLLVINELSRASGAVKDALLGALDSRDSATVTLPDGETVRVNKGFRCVITSNESADELDPALRDRCEAVIDVSEPHPALIAALNQAWANLGDVVNDSYSDPDRRISTRASFAYAKLRTAGVDKKMAITLAYGAKRAKDIETVFSLREVK